MTDSSESEPFGGVDAHNAGELAVDGDVRNRSGLNGRLVRRFPTISRSKWVVLSAVLLGNFAAGIVFTLLSVARQTIAVDLHTKASLVTWAFTAPSLAGAVFGPALGRLGDLRGHKRLHLVALAGGMATALLVATAWNVASLIFFRTLAATIGAALGPTSLALIFRSFDREDRVKAMGYWSLVLAGSPVIGVFVGGPIVEHFGWRWMFIGQVPLFAIAIVVASIALIETPRRAVGSFDWKGAAVLAIGTLSVLLSINRGAVWGWTDPRIVAGFVLGPVLAATFLWIERRAPEPLLPLTMLRNRNVLGSLSAQMFAVRVPRRGPVFVERFAGRQKPVRVDVVPGESVDDCASDPVRTGCAARWFARDPGWRAGDGDVGDGGRVRGDGAVCSSTSGSVAVCIGIGDCIGWARVRYRAAVPDVQPGQLRTGIVAGDDRCCAAGGIADRQRHRDGRFGNDCGCRWLPL